MEWSNKSIKSKIIIIPCEQTFKNIIFHNIVNGVKTGASIIFPSFNIVQSVLFLYPLFFSCIVSLKFWLLISYHENLWAVLWESVRGNQILSNVKLSGKVTRKITCAITFEDTVISLHLISWELFYCTNLFRWIL